MEREFQATRWIGDDRDVLHLGSTRSTSHVLSEGLSGVVIVTIEARRVIDGEPGVFPAQEDLGELLRDEAQLQEQADGAPAEALAQAIDVVNREVVELPGGVESALEDEGGSVG